MTAILAVAQEQTQRPAKPELIEVKRFGMPDLQVKGMFLTQRHRQKYPHLGDRDIFNYFRGLMYSKEFLFLHTDHAVALAQLISNNLFEPTTVIERFVLATDDEHKAEAAGMYDHFAKWASECGAREIVVGRFSDVEPAAIKARFVDLGEPGKPAPFMVSARNQMIVTVRGKT